MAIDFAKAHHQKPNLKYQIGDFFRFKKQTDVVISFETIEHMKAPALNVILDSLAKRAQRLLIGSIPYKEKPGNPHHMFFHLEEKDLNTLNDKGLLSFYYQNKDGKVDSQINGDKVVKNLIFTLEKK